MTSISLHTDPSRTSQGKSLSNTRKTAIGSTTAIEVAADIRRRILQGEFVPGQRLTINEVATLCKVSHMPVRVALHELESEGVLTLFPHRGAVIRSTDARFVRNLLDLRAAVEIMLTERCAHLIGKAELAELDVLALDFEAAAERGDTSAMVKANLRLHYAINRVADNPEALQVLNRGQLLIEALRMRYGFGSSRPAQVAAEHRALLRAIARKDAKGAGKVARQHCEGARDDLLAMLAE
jgi:DNA-binding GntR family transcriptional regulator